MRLRRLIKKNAALALRRNWSRAAGVSLLLLMFGALFASLERIAVSAFDITLFDDMSTPGIMLDDLPAVSPAAMAVMLGVALLYYVTYAPVKLGAARWFYNLTDGRTCPVLELLCCFTTFRGFFRALWLELLLTVKKAFWSIIFLAPPAAMLLLGDHWRKEASRNIERLFSIGLEILGGVLILLLGCFLAVWLRRYCLSAYMIAADDTIGAIKAVKRSVLLTKGRLTEFLVLELSLIGWRLADSLVLPRLFTMPYIGTIYSLYARYLIELNAKNEPAPEQQSRQEQQPAEDAVKDRADEKEDA